MLFKKGINKIVRWSVVNKMFSSLVFAGMIIEFSQVGAGFIDGLIISRFLGSEMMAAEGIAYPIFSIVGVISGLIAAGMQVTCSQLVGRGKLKDVNRFFSQSLLFGGVLSVIVALLTILFARQFAVLLGASENAASLALPASQYLTGVAVGIPALVIVAILSPALQIDSGRKIIQTGAIIGSVADVVWDIIAVKLGWGLLGIGLATAVSFYLNLLYLCLYFLKKERMIHFAKPDVPLKDFWQMLLNGTEKATKRLANVIRPVFLNNIIIAYGGAAAMSALSIRNSIGNFTDISASGIAAAVSLLTGLYFGEMNEEAIIEVKKRGWKYIVSFSSVICAVLFIFAKPIASIYADNDAVMEYVVFCIRMLSLQIGLQALLKSRISYLQAISRVVNMNLLLFASQLVLIVANAFILGKIFGVYGILSCFVVSDALSLIMVYVYYQIKTRKILPDMKELLNLPAEYYLKPGDVISLDIRDMDDAVITSEQIQLFCKGHKFDSKTCYYASLAFEEIASNIIKYGFPQNKNKDPIIDLRIVASAHTLVMRIRDNCPHFDITKKIAEVNESDDTMVGLGIKITSEIAKNIEYIHAFETNNIIITYNR